MIDGLTKAKREALAEIARLGHMKLRGRGRWGHPHSSLVITTKTVNALERDGLVSFMGQGGWVVPAKRVLRDGTPE